MEQEAAPGVFSAVDEAGKARGGQWEVPEGMAGSGEAPGNVSFLRQHFATLWTVARQAPLSMRFSRQEYWSGLP